MRGGTVQINWHDTKPVLTLDFHPISGTLATGGADFDIKIWQLQSTEPQKKVPSVSYLNSLSYHSCAVNALRFSNSGELLASGADGGEMILWKLHIADGVETWKVHKTLTFHRKDILDLQWSKDGDFLISGSVDNSCIIWDALKGSVLQIINEHCHYVQGVAWDPLGKFVTSLSSDRTCRVYVKKPRHKTKGSENHSYVCQHIISKIEHQADEDSKALKHHLFHDETLPSFFRRLAWSPDGSFLLVPGGSYKFSPTSEPVNTAYVFSRKDFSRPALQLPGATKPVVAVRFCPLAFSLLGSKSANGLFKLPYRLIFAVATLNSLYIYDTENANPIAILAGLHYAAITDVAWSPDAKYLALSSQDGYCTLVEFENQELGSPVPIAEKGVADIGGKNLDTTNVEPMEIDEVRSESYVTHQKSENDENNDKGGMAVPTTSTQKSENDGNNDKGGTPIRTANTQKSENDGNKEKGGTAIRTANTQKSENDANKEKGGTAIQNTNTQTSQIEENKEKGSAATPATSKQPQASNKQARRRITPMAIDP